MSLIKPLQIFENLTRRAELALFGTWALWLSALSLLGPASFVRFHDNGDGNVPFHVSAAANHGFWYPYQGAGVDLFAQGMFNEVDALFFMAMPAWLASGLVLFLQRFIAGIFMYRLLRDDFEARPLVAIFGSLIYSAQLVGLSESSNGLPIGHFFTMPLIPALLWLLPRIAARPRYGELASAVLGLVVAASTLYVFQVFIFPFLVFWFWSLRTHLVARFWRMLAIFFVAYLIGEFPTLWIGALNAVDSHRVGGEAARVLAGVRERALEQLVWAREYPIQLTIVGAGLSYWATHRLPPPSALRRVFGYSLGYVVFLRLFYVFYPLFWEGIWKHLPVVRGFTVERLLLPESFLLAVCACLALEMLARPLCASASGAARRVTSERLAAIAIVMIFIHSGAVQLITFGYQFSGRIGGSNFSSVYHDANLLKLKEMSRDSPPFRVQGSGHVHAAWLASYEFESTGGYLNIYPKRYHEFWTEVLRPMSKINPDRFEYFQFMGHRIYLYHPPFNMALLSLANVRYVASSSQISDDKLVRVREINPLYSTDKDWEAMSLWERCFSYFKKNYPGVAPYVYENPDYFPRVFSPGSVRLFDSKEALLEALGAGTTDLFAKSVYLEKQFADGLGRVGPIGPSTVRILKRQSDRWEISTSGELASVLVVTNTFTKYWHAYVDDTQTEVLPAYHTFQAVVVPKGQHVVSLRYEPPYKLSF